MNPVPQIPVKTFFKTMQENTCHTEIMSNFSEETVTDCYCDRILAETFSDFMITKFSILAKDSFIEKRRLCLWLNASALYIACTMQLWALPTITSKKETQTHEDCCCRQR